MEDDIVDLNSASDKCELIQALAWWEKKRPLFNLVVGSSGGVIILFNMRLFIFPFDLFGILLYGVFFNLLFSVGFLLEVFDIYYFKGSLNIKGYRLSLFVIGLLASAFVTFVFGLAYYYSPWLLFP